jgi:hypothetical protein
MRLPRWIVASGCLALLPSCSEAFQASQSTSGPGAGGGTSQTGGGATQTSTGVAQGGGGSGGTTCYDADADGVTDCAGDCDDADPTVFPEAPEICGDGVANGCSGSGDPFDICQGIGTYVSALIGDDANPGTQAEPLATISAGILNAIALGKIQPVFVAEGSYAEDVVLEEAVDLLGGHQCDMSTCTWARELKTYTSVIVDQDADGVYAGHAITRETLVEGFTVMGKSGNPGFGNTFAALFIQGAPTIRANEIIAGTVTGCGTCGARGVALSGAPSGNLGALVERNKIQGGDSSELTIGIDVSNSSFAEIASNEIKGGTGTWTRCIAIAASAASGTVIKSNDLHAGSCAGNNTTFAISLGQGVDAEVDANRINADPAQLGTCPGFAGSWWTGGIESEGSVATIRNNVVFGVPSPRSAAILLADCEGLCQVGQAVVSGNTLDGGGQPPNGSDTVSAAVVFKTWKATQNVVVGRVTGNILLGGKAANRFGGYEDVYLAGSTARPKDFDNNDITGVSAHYLLWNGSAVTAINNITDVNSFVNGANDNVDFSCPLDATFHLGAGSPCIDKGTANDASASDIDGDPRPMGSAIDIGADEAG